MTNKDDYNLDRMYENRTARDEGPEVWRDRARRFLRYLSTRNVECWGFFAAGFLVATIF